MLKKLAGYDQEIYIESEQESINLYLDEGKSLEEAERLGRRFFKEYKRLNWKTENLWRKARNHEITCGLNPSKQLARQQDQFKGRTKPNIPFDRDEGDDDAE